MKILKEIILDAYYEVCGNPCGTSLSTSREADKLFRSAAKLWLQQKQKEVYEYRENYQISPENIIDELLEELNENRN